MKNYQLVLGALIALGCSGQSIDVGPGGGGGGSSAQGNGASGSSGSSALPGLACVNPAPLTAWPDPMGCVAGSDLPLVGTWHGYVENGTAPWDDLTLVINGASVTGGVCGTLTIGTGTPPAPATDPSNPPGTDRSTGATPGVTPGFPLTLLRGTTDGTRVRFSVAQTEPYRSWCGIQSSYLNDAAPNGCSCLPNWAAMGSTSSTPSSGPCTLLDPTHAHNLTVGCAQFQLCVIGSNTCSCNAAGCDASVTGSGADFDLRFTANTAEGSNTESLGDRTQFVLAE